MGDLGQETYGVEEQLQDPSTHLALLRLNSFESSSAAPTTAKDNPSCPTCGCINNSSTTSSLLPTINPNPMKRPSPEPPAAPKSKKPVLSHAQSLSGFSKIPLPSTTALAPPQSAPVLRLCVSDPCTPPRTTGAAQPLHSVIPQSPPEDAKMGAGSPFSKGSTSASALPPKVPVLTRSVSDPTPSPMKTLSRSSSFNEVGMDLTREESPNTKRLRRIKDRVKEMSQLLDATMRDDQVAGTEETITKDDCETECEEAVRVEKSGESLIIHFKCPCSKGYQILLNGGNCYYKLI